MKRFTKHLFLVLAGATMMFSCASEDKATQEQQEQQEQQQNTTKKVDLANMTVPVPASLLEASAVNKGGSIFDSNDVCAAAYIDVDKLVKKSGITGNQRKLFAAMSVQDINDEFLNNYIYNTVLNLDNSGIKFSKPIYMTVNAGYVKEDPTIECILIAEVSNIDTLNQVLKEADVLMSSTSSGARVMCENYNDMCIAIGYNNKYMAYVVTNADKYYSRDLLEKALANANMDLSAFNSHDVAIYYNYERLYKELPVIEKFINDQYSNNYYYEDYYYEDEYYYDDYYYNSIELTPDSEIKNLISEHFNDFKGCKMIAGITFDPGRVVIDAQYAGFDELFKEYNFYQGSTNANLKYLPSNAYGFANLCINGNKLAEIINTFMTRDVKNALAYNIGMPVNELTTYLSIATDAIKSIDGDVTVALNSLDIEYVTEYDYYWDEYYEVETLSDLEAVAIVNTNSNYVIENVKLIPILQEVEKGKLYTTSFNGFDFNVGQVDNTLYAGVNTRCDNLPRQNMETKWAEEFKNSYAYIVFDVQNFFNSKYGKTIRKNLQSDSDTMPLDKVINMVDSVWFNVKDINNMELVLSLTNKEDNALEQIVNFGFELAQTYNF